MPRLVLHIGLEKTGTKALQSFLARNRRPLRMMGVRYPRCEGPDRRAWLYHRDLGVTLTQGDGTQWGPASDVIAAYAEKAAEVPVTVLSHEMLSRPDPAIAARLAPLGREFDVQVVIYLRRQDEWALSAYRKAVLAPGEGEIRRVQDWVQDPGVLPRLDYDAILNGWEAAFGAAAITPRLYPHHLPLIGDFLSVTGLPAAAGLLPGHGRRINESVPAAEVAAALYANGGPNEVPELSQPERDALMARFEDGNEALRARYFPERQTLFGVA